MADGNRFEPLIVGFTCNWCSYRAADGAGMARIKYAPNVRLIRLMCSGRMDPIFILKALAGGADGVLVSGCHPGDCHYVEQNFKAIRRFDLLKRVLAGLGVKSSGCAWCGPRPPKACCWPRKSTRWWPRYGRWGR